MRGQPQASPARSPAIGRPRRAAAHPPWPPGTRRRDVARPLPDPVAIRLCRVPETAPPYDDERPRGDKSVGGDEGVGDTGLVRADVLTAAIVAALESGGPGSSQADEALAQGPQASGAGPEPPRPTSQPGNPTQPGKGRAARLASPGPGGWPSKFAQVLAETLAGSRPPAQITPWTTERARSHIRRLGPMLSAGQQPQVQRILTSLPAAGVMEMSVVVGFGPRVRALAIRLERTDPRPTPPGRPSAQPRWLCTAVEAA